MLAILLHVINVLFSSSKFICFSMNYRYGLRGKELITTIGKTMLQSGGTFGTFMAIGSGIRC